MAESSLFLRIEGITLMSSALSVLPSSHSPCSSSPVSTIAHVKFISLSWSSFRLFRLRKPDWCSLHHRSYQLLWISQCLLDRDRDRIRTWTVMDGRHPYCPQTCTQDCSHCRCCLLDSSRRHHSRCLLRVFYM